MDHAEALQYVDDVVDSAALDAQLPRALVQVEQSALRRAVEEQEAAAEFTQALLLSIVGGALHAVVSNVTVSVRRGCFKTHADLVRRLREESDRLEVILVRRVGSFFLAREGVLARGLNLRVLDTPQAGHLGDFQTVRLAREDLDCGISGKCGTFGIIFRIEHFLLLFWRTFGRASNHQSLTCLQGNFVTSFMSAVDGSFKLLQVPLVWESHSIVFAPKISDQLGVSAKEGIIFRIEEDA